MKCEFNGIPGWKCVIKGSHDVVTKDGYIPHGFVPRWWNISLSAMRYRRSAR